MRSLSLLWAMMALTLAPGLLAQGRALGTPPAADATAVPARLPGTESYTARKLRQGPPCPAFPCSAAFAQGGCSCNDACQCTAPITTLLASPGQGGAFAVSCNTTTGVCMAGPGLSATPFIALYVGYKLPQTTDSTPRQLQMLGTNLCLTIIGGPSAAQPWTTRAELYPCLPVGSATNNQLWINGHSSVGWAFVQSLTNQSLSWQPSNVPNRLIAPVSPGCSPDTSLGCNWRMAQAGLADGYSAPGSSQPPTARPPPPDITGNPNAPKCDYP